MKWIQILHLLVFYFVFAVSQASDFRHISYVSVFDTRKEMWFIVTFLFYTMRSSFIRFKDFVSNKIIINPNDLIFLYLLISIIC